MTSIEQLESEIAKKLEGAEDRATIVTWLIEKVVESYKKGIAEGLRHAALAQESNKRRLHF